MASRDVFMRSVKSRSLGLLVLSQVIVASVFSPSAIYAKVPLNSYLIKYIEEADQQFPRQEQLEADQEEMREAQQTRRREALERQQREQEERQQAEEQRISQQRQEEQERQQQQERRQQDEQRARDQEQYEQQRRQEADRQERDRIEQQQRIDQERAESQRIDRQQREAEAERQAERDRLQADQRQREIQERERAQQLETMRQLEQQNERERLDQQARDQQIADEKRQREQQERDRQAISVKPEPAFSVETRPQAPDTPASQGSGGTLQNPINRNDPQNSPPPVQSNLPRDTIQPAVPSPVYGNGNQGSGQQGSNNPVQSSGDNYGSTPSEYGRLMNQSDVALNNRLDSSSPNRIEFQFPQTWQVTTIYNDGRIANWRAEANREIAQLNGGGVQSVGNTQNQSRQPSSTPRVPTGLYPINQGELAQPIPLGWAPVQGATSYKITVKDQTTGRFSVDELTVTSIPYEVRVPAGHVFTWDVMACNQSGCSAPSANGQFRTGGEGNSSLAISSQCGQITNYQQSIIDGYHGLTQQTGVPKPSKSTLCRWQQDGSLEKRLIQFQSEIRAAANSGPNIPSSERHRLAMIAVSSSPEVKRAIDNFYFGLVKFYATKGITQKLNSKEKMTIDTLVFIKEGIDQIRDNKKESSEILRGVSNINFVASYALDQFSNYYLNKVGLDIPVSSLTNLAGTAIGVYASTYFTGN